MNAITDLLSYVGLLLVIIGLHEAGHFAAAKRFGLVADVFSLGFGKVLFAHTDRRGTSWQIRMLPFGGFIKLNEARLAALPPMQRIAIYAAGPAVNMVLGLVLVALAGIQIGAPVLKSLEISAQAMPMIVSTLVGAVSHVFAGDVSNLAGPIGAAMASGDAVRLNSIFMFAGLFSWSVGILNFLPVPLLDGGQIVFAGFEAMGARPSRNTMKYAAWAGKSFIAYMIVAGTVADFVRIVG